MQSVPRNAFQQLLHRVVHSIYRLVSLPENLQKLLFWVKLETWYLLLMGVYLTV